MVALLFLLLNLLIAPFKSTSRPEAERGHSERNEFRVNSLEGYARCLVDQWQLIHFCGQKNRPKPPFVDTGPIAVERQAGRASCI